MPLVNPQCGERGMGYSVSHGQMDGECVGKYVDRER